MKLARVALLALAALASTAAAVALEPEDAPAPDALLPGGLPAPRALTAHRVDGLGNLIVAIGSGLSPVPITKLFVEMADGRSFAATLAPGGDATQLRSAVNVPVHGALDEGGLLVLDPAFSRCNVVEGADAPAAGGSGAAASARMVCQIGDKSYDGVTPERAAAIGRSLLSAGMGQHAVNLRLPSLRRLESASRRSPQLEEGGVDTAGIVARAAMQVDSTVGAGDRTMLMVRVTFQGEATSSNPWGDAAFARVAADVGVLAQLASYGMVRTTVTTVPCNISIALAYSTNPSAFSEQIIRTKTTEALAAASGACKFTTSNFDHLAIFMRNDPMFGYAGLGSIPGASIWITGPKYAAYPGADSTVLSHEYYHNLGVNHASAREVGTGKTVEYGHMIDLMGSRTLARNPASTTLGIWWKAGLAWVTSSRVLTLPFDAMKSANVAPQGSLAGAPLDVSNSWTASLIPDGGLRTDPFTDSSAAYPVIETQIAASERDASTAAQSSSTAVDTVRIADPTGLRETWTYIGYRRDNALIDPRGGAEVASMGYGWALPGTSVYPASVFPAMGLSTLVDPVPATESQIDAIIAPDQALVFAHPFAHVAGAAGAGVTNSSIVAQVVSKGSNPAGSTDANDAALNVRLTKLDDTGAPRVGRGCSADGSCQPVPGGEALACGATVTGTLTPGAPAMVYKLTASGSGTQTATVTTCTSASPAWSSSTAKTTLTPALAVFRGVYPSAQAYFGADITMGSTDFSNLTLSDGSTSSTFIAKRCGTLTIPLNGVEPWYVVVAPSSSAVPSFSGSFTPVPFTLTASCGATAACVRNAITVNVTGPSYGYLYNGVYRLNPVTPIINSRPFWVRHDNTRGVASRYDLYSDSTGSWILYSYAVDENVVKPRLKSDVAGSVFIGLTGTNPTDFDIAISCACPEALYNANGGTGASVTCGACSGLSTTAPGSSGASACKCLPGAGFSSGSCSICPPGSAKAGISNSACTSCPSGTTSPGGATSIAACRATKSCDAVSISVKYTSDNAAAPWISGTYIRQGDADYLVNGYPVYLYTPPASAGDPLYLAFFVAPSMSSSTPGEGQWRFTTSLATATSYYAYVSGWGPIHTVSTSAFVDAGNNHVYLSSVSCTCSGISGGGSPNADGRCPGIVSSLTASLLKPQATPCPDGSTRTGCTSCPTATPIPVVLGDDSILNAPGVRLVTTSAEPGTCSCPATYVSGSQKSCAFPANLVAAFTSTHPAAGISGAYNLSAVDVVTVPGSASLSAAVPVYRRTADVNGRPVYLRYVPRPSGASLAAMAFNGNTYSEWVFATDAAESGAASGRFAYIPSAAEGQDIVLPTGEISRSMGYDPSLRVFTSVSVKIDAAAPIDRDPFSPSPTPSSTASRSVLPTTSPTGSVTAAATRSMTASSSAMATRSVSPTSTSSVTPTSSTTPSVTPTGSATATRSISVTPSRSITPSIAAFVPGSSDAPRPTLDATGLRNSQYNVTTFTATFSINLPAGFLSALSSSGGAATPIDTALGSAQEREAIYHAVTKMATYLDVPRENVRIRVGLPAGISTPVPNGGFARRQLQTTLVIAASVSVLTTAAYPDSVIVPRINALAAAPATALAPLAASVVNGLNTLVPPANAINGASVNVATTVAPTTAAIQPSPAPAPSGDYVNIGGTKVEVKVVIAVAASVGGFLLVVIGVGIYCCTCRKGRSCCASAKVDDPAGGTPGAKVSIHEDPAAAAAEHTAAATLVASPSTRNITSLTASPAAYSSGAPVTAYVVPPPGSDRALVGIMDPSLMPSVGLAPAPAPVVGAPGLAVTGVDSLQRYPTRLSLSRSMTAAQMQQAQLAQMQAMQQAQAMQHMQAMAQMQAMQQQQAAALGYTAYGGGYDPAAAQAQAQAAMAAAYGVPMGYGSPYGTMAAPAAPPPAGVGNGLDVPSFRRSQSLSRAGFAMSAANLSPSAGRGVGGGVGSPGVPSYVAAAAPYMKR